MDDASPGGSSRIRSDQRKEPALNAEPSAQLRLLDVAALDSKLDQLAHQERTLPAIAQLSELESRIRTLRDRVVAAETEESDIARQQAKADSDVEQVRTRSARDQQRLDSGAVTSAKDLESLQHEIASLARRQAELEDVELEVMERLEEVQSALAGLQAELAEAEKSAADLVVVRDDALADLAKDREFVTRQRAELAKDLPEDLVKLYTKLRADNGGIGAARLHQGRCEGCRLELNAIELSKARAAEPDEVLRCEECRRILVRTNESGL